MQTMAQARPSRSVRMSAVANTDSPRQESVRYPIFSLHFFLVFFWLEVVRWPGSGEPGWLLRVPVRASSRIRWSVAGLLRASHLEATWRAWRPSGSAVMSVFAARFWGWWRWWGEELLSPPLSCFRGRDSVNLKSLCL